MIELIDSRKTKDKSGTYLGRGGVFGNPYYVTGSLEKIPKGFDVESEEEGYKKYPEYLNKMWIEDEYFRLCVTDLVKDIQNGKHLVFGCNCGLGQYCHGRLLIDFLETMAQFLQPVSKYDALPDDEKPF